MSQINTNTEQNKYSLLNEQHGFSALGDTASILLVKRGIHWGE
jgi:hypothetical protein